MTAPVVAELHPTGTPGPQLLLVEDEESIGSLVSAYLEQTGYRVAWVRSGEEALSTFDQLVTLPCYDWQHVIVLPAGHALAQQERITLEHLAGEPLISYHPSFTGRTRIDQAFAAKGLAPNVVLEAIDSDVIKTYVRLGLGVGIVAEMAVRDDPACAPGGELVTRPAGALFGNNVARLAFKRGAYLRNFVYGFAELLSDRLTRALIMRAMNGGAENYEL